MDTSAAVVPVVDPIRPPKGDSAKSGGGLAVPIGSGQISETLGGSGAGAGCCLSLSASAGFANENGDGVDSAGFDKGTSPNTEAVGVASTSLAGSIDTEDPNIALGWLPPLPKMVFLLGAVGGGPNNDGELSLGTLLGSVTLDTDFSSFSPSQRGFSTSLVGVACAGLNTLICGGVGESGLFVAAAVVKKLGTPELVGGDDTDAGLLDAAKFAKKLGTPESVVSGKDADGGLFGGSGFAKKLGVTDRGAGASAMVTFGGSGVDVVSVIEGACGGCAKNEDVLGGCSGCSFIRGGGETELAADPFIAPGLVKVNGSEDTGGSFAFVKSCWIGDVCEIK